MPLVDKIKRIGLSNAQLDNLLGSIIATRKLDHAAAP
jgi:hypothetical protein